MNSIKKIFALFLSCQMIVSLSGDMIAIGIHNGTSTSTYNKGRRIDTNILQFVYNNPNI